ncbi:Ger(x)C family spore germination protein [Paucisalibacillus globulus]|uniref:Ger(x)C family spore germination protein n=1 Tax=Paucisalibacillus globulus TaxID=351095 RepID=UPI000BB70A84|nr:Ger(x)C family spore germination protein [Paucisalibacillus globulus]
MRKITLMILSMILFLSSCVQTFQLEDLGIITSRGVDRADNNDIEITMSVLQFQANSTKPTIIVSGVGSTIKGAVEDAGKKVSQELVPGKLELEMYSRELAEDGLKSYIDTLKRDANIPDTVRLAVTEDNSREILHTQEEHISTNVGEFLHGLVQPGAEQRLFPEVSLQKFARIINDEGIDPILPIIGLREETPVITGIALFKDDKMKGQLPIKDEYYFTIIEGLTQEELIEIEIPTDSVEKYLIHGNGGEEQLKIVLLIEKGTGDIQLTDKDKLHFDTNIKIELSLLEISREYKLDDAKALKKLEQEIEKVITSRYEEIFSYLKEVNTDVFGYGEKYRIKKKGGKLSDKEWDKSFPTIHSNFNVNVNIIRHGTVNR